LSQACPSNEAADQLVIYAREKEREKEISSFEIPKSAPKLSMVLVGSITTVSLFHAMTEPGCVLVLLLLWH
jgi:hypothetical protein